MKYYKAMNKDLTCRSFQYEIGKTYELPKDVKLELCKNGFHFCDILNACFNYYDEDDSIICEVEPLGKIIHDEYDNKLVTDKIKIVRQLSDEEIEEQKYVIQNGVTIIDKYVFNSCTNLKEINIPNSVTTIGNDAFYDCNSLETICIPTDFDIRILKKCKLKEEIPLLKQVKIIRI